MDATEPEERDASGPGARLRAARLRAGMSRADVAGHLNLDEATIGALEDEQHATLGAAVYVRGHLHRYAQLLGEAPQEIAALYAGRQDPRRMPDLTRIVARPLTGQGRRMNLGFWPAAALAAILAVICVIWWALRVAPHGPH